MTEEVAAACFLLLSGSMSFVICAHALLLEWSHRKSFVGCVVCRIFWREASRRAREAERQCQI